jgi:hypothetical protein
LHKIKNFNKSNVLISIESLNGTLEKNIEFNFNHMGKNVLSSINVKQGKAIPLQPLTGPEGSRSLRLPDFKTIDK